MCGLGHHRSLYFFIPTHIVSYVVHSVLVFVNPQCYASSIHWQLKWLKTKNGYFVFHVFRKYDTIPINLNRRRNPWNTLNFVTFGKISAWKKCDHYLEICFCLQCYISSATHLRPRTDIGRCSKIHIKRYFNHRHQFFILLTSTLKRLLCKIKVSIHHIRLIVNISNTLSFKFNSVEKLTYSNLNTNYLPHTSEFLTY